MAELITGLDAARVRANAAAVRERIDAAARGAGREAATVRMLAAVKYVPAQEMPALVEAGITLVGENRAQDLEAKATAHPDLEWHFIGALQSRKVKAITPYATLIHSVASDSALRRLADHATDRTAILVEVNVAGEQGKAGIAPDELDAFLERCPVEVRGLMTMPPAAEDPEDSRRWFAALRELAAARDLPELSMGTSQDYDVAVVEGATIVRVGSALYR